MNVFISLIGVFLVACIAAGANERMSVQEAFAHLNSTHAQYPDGKNVQDSRAIEILRSAPEEATTLVVAALSRGGYKGREDAQILMVLVPKEKQRGVMKTIWATYPMGDVATPFQGAIAVAGDEKDMERLRAIILKDPNSVRSVELAKVMIEGENPYALQVLSDLKESTPGAWQTSKELIAHFAKSSSDANLPPAKSARDNMQTSSKHGSSTAESSQRGNLILVWVLGAMTAVAITFWVIRRR